MKNIFLDTNVIVDLLLERKPWIDDIEKILTLYEFDVVEELNCASISLSTVFYLMSRAKISRDKIITKMKWFRTFCHVTSVGENIFDSALDSQFDDLEDAMQYFSALKGKCDVIITRNKKDFSESKIQVLEPQEFLDSFCKEIGE